ncbi:calpain-like cysteine peptidase, putative [Trypanosoma brucei gambiense DAL972]|uniref:Calpain-like cysteine peptidase, putative n=2 Tax=Trypanosoma brucei TaxID=5691 RepID=C9ZIE8_TRYB9|nr:calpain-like cysteine peptidase, putative [Trypanosoma brucei gambiense DAL972]RHW74184.1 Calpain-like protein 1.2 [Trypanosoma brucei equiperdum]CBH08940.1 calpain-like cysteine peptidase, putative [Trypanosoma brucei gambiense DAL972]|eukprot:XP_011771381.1 calpain-like cysteine peptidase, putative [Trypanosoma brucei gambiense DAL972]
MSSRNGSLAGCYVDEFDEAATTKPETSSIYRYGRPVYEGTPTACFEGGLLFRIVEEGKNNRWSFYNDTPSNQMRVEVIFGANSAIKALGNTSLIKLPDGSYKGTVTVYPLETEVFVEGKCDTYESNIVAEELSTEYLQDVAVQNAKVIEKETQEVSKLGGENSSPDDTLAACIAKKTKFVDLIFPPGQESLQIGTPHKLKVIPWERPSMYLSDENALHARLFRNNIHPGNIDEGELGDSWFTGALACMAEFPDRVRDMFRHPRSIEEGKNEREIGAYRVTFNKDGWWTNVIIDDYLPCSGGHPMFARSYGDPMELWVSLAQKAYAKLHGGYGFLVVGDPLRALQDLTGFPCSSFNTAFENAKMNGGEELFVHLLQYGQTSYQTILTVPTRGALKLQGASVEAYEATGLLPGHVYTVLSVMPFPEYNLRLLLLRNSWANHSKHRWNGAWKRGSEKWKQYPGVAAACAGACDADGVLCVEWSEALALFAGCGVCFVQDTPYDYRIRGCFQKAIPSVCLEISVSVPIVLCLSLTQEGCHGTDKADYSPIMLSVAHGSGCNQIMTVEANSGFDADHPNPGFTFFETREANMFFHMIPEKSPYLIIPRTMTPYKELSYVLSIHSPVEIGTPESAVFVAFRTLAPECGAFANCRNFQVQGSTCQAEFQARGTEQFFPDIYLGNSIELS